MSDIEDDDIPVCPLCVEEMDLSDKNFLPCPCGYRVCMWCWHHIRENLNGLCPACRTPYNSDPHAFSAVDRQEIVKKNRERKQREKHDKKGVEKPIIGGGVTTTGTAVAVKSSGSAIADRKNLHNFRVVQRNLVYVIGLPLSASNEELLRKAEYFGQYGKIVKVVVHRNSSISQTTVSAYVTFAFKEDAKAAIQALDGYWIEGHPLRASFGTTKYCNNFIRNVPCTNPECVYLHELGDEDDRFTKEEIQAGHTKLIPTPGKDQSIVTGCGGPSGTGKRPAGETILPPPVFIQDNSIVNNISKGSLSRSESINALHDVKEITNYQSNSSSESDNINSGIKDRIIASNHDRSTMMTKEDLGIKHANSYVDGPSIEEKTIETKDTDESSNGRSQSPPACSSEINNREQQQQQISAPTDLGNDDHLHESEEELILQNDVHTLVQHNQHIKATSSSNAGPSSPAFNGITWNAVFPVPSSSLSNPAWSTILRISHSNLGTNPFGMVKLPVSDLLELTLPPVDAVSLSSWPKPSSYYSVALQQQFNPPEYQDPARSFKQDNNLAHPSIQGETITVQQHIENAAKSVTNSGGQSTSGIHALKQIFPGVNLSFGVQGRF